MKRRNFIKSTAGATAAAAAMGAVPGMARSVTKETRSPAGDHHQWFKISLAQWSLHKSYFGDTLSRGWQVFGTLLQTDPDKALAGELDPIDFPVVARQKFDIGAIEYVNTFYFNKAKNVRYLKELKNRCHNEGVKSLLIMVDAEGQLGNPDKDARMEAVENHYRWIEAARFLGCHSIRVNAGSSGSYEEQMKLAADGLHELCEYGDAFGINVIVENHGGLSSNAEWLTGVMKMVNHRRIGTLPDFGNFWISGSEEYDRYKGVTELMPWAKGVSAKSHDFDENGDEVNTDYYKMMEIVRNAGWRGHVGIEYEGNKLSEADGIMATKKLLIKAGKKA